ncbi:MAG: hypothetical protein P8J02_02490 [Yoonia sp.]|nr:hypothetical protein [Yoonia sp.]
MTLFTDITFAQICLAALTVGVIEHVVVRFAPDAILRHMGYTA